MKVAPLLGCCFLLACAGGPVRAADETDALRQIVTRQTELIQRLNIRIERLESRLDELEQRANASADARPSAPTAHAQPVSSPAGAPSSARTAGQQRVPKPADSSAEQALGKAGESQRREQERLVRAAFQHTLIERGGLLLPRHTLDIQPSASYTHSSAENIVIDGYTILPVLVVGDIVSQKVQRTVSQTAATFRFGLPWDSQLDVSVPYTAQTKRSFSADNKETTLGSSGIGDADIGFSRQVLHSRSLWPDLIASLRWKTTTGTSPFDVDPKTELATGTGYNSVNVSLTGVKVVDPLVYFGSIDYSRNFARTEPIGRFDPGDSVGFSLGVAIALNLNGSLSFSYQQQSTRRTRVDGVGVPGSYLTTGVLTVGASFAMSDNLTADLSLGVGVTADSPDVQLQASFPIRRRRVR